MVVVGCFFSQYELFNVQYTLLITVVYEYVKRFCCAVIFNVPCKVLVNLKIQLYSQ
jgi:hypothetical protein